MNHTTVSKIQAIILDRLLNFETFEYKNSYDTLMISSDPINSGKRSSSTKLKNNIISSFNLTPAAL